MQRRMEARRAAAQRGRRAGARGRAAVVDLAGARQAAIREAFRIATLALLALGGLGLAGCSGRGGDGAKAAGEEAPARSGSTTASTSGGDVEGREGAVPGAGQAPFGAESDTTPAAGRAGSYTAAQRSAGGGINTPGSGALHDGDPSDASVRAIVDAIHTGEVEASRLALQKGQHAEVRRYAQAMLAAHEAPAGAAPRPQGNTGQDLLTPLREAQAKQLQALRAAPVGPRFDRQYVLSQIDGHQGALQTLERLESAVQDPTLTDQVRRLQTTVEAHLAEARRVQGVVDRARPQ